MTYKIILYYGVSVMYVKETDFKDFHLLLQK